MAQYIINKGDTLSGIAQKFGYGGDYMSIARANNIANPNMINAGATLNIPDRSAPGAAPASVPAPVQSQPQQPQVQSGGVPPVDMSKYQGWNDQAAIQADWNNTWQSKTGQSGGGTSGSGVSSMFQQSGPATPDLMGQWTNFLNTINTTYQPQATAAQAEADTIQKEVDTRTQALNVALGKINDNPYYSEATRVGRAAKLKEAYNNDVQAINGRLTNAQKKVLNVQDQIAKAKADAQVNMNIQTQQYNIDNAKFQQNLQMVNNMLSTGALNNASGADIAQIAITTGMSTSMIQSIINQSKQANLKIDTYDDGTNTYLITYDDGGNIINKQLIGPSKSAKSSISIPSFSNITGSDTSSGSDWEMLPQTGSDISSLW